MSNLKYSDKVPTAPGWYWRRDSNSELILKVSDIGPWQKHWTQMKAEMLAAFEGQDEKQKQLADLNWVVEWAGPISKPEL